MSPYPHLFSPIAVGHLELANRILMGPMHTGLEDTPDLDRLAAYFAERARGGCALMVTGAFSPNHAGRLSEAAVPFDRSDQVPAHRRVTEAVHAAGGRILLQMIHAGRYGYHADIVAPSPLASPINKHTPREMTDEEIEATIEDFVRTSELASDAGYDGVEVMGSEGYLLTQFIATRTNRRDDRWGGGFENRIRLPVEIVRRTRDRLGPDFVLMFRLSVLDLVDNGPTDDEIVALAQAVEAAGADVLNSGIGWHEAPVPTIAQAVPRAAFVDFTARLKGAVGIPLIASNRINTPETAEAVLAAGQADMVSMARPFLADAAFAAKAAAGRADEINTCIACNQACLDRYFTGQVASCLVNPRACRETELNWYPAETPRRIAVVGAGVAGLAAATTLAERGHDVVLFEAADRIGGQFNLARQIPGKQEFDETLRYFTTRLGETGVTLRLGHPAAAASLVAGGFEAVVLAAGIVPRRFEIEGADHPMVAGYTELLSGVHQPGRRVAIVGAGGIGFDVALFLLEVGAASFTDPVAFRRAWGIGETAEEAEPRHQITMLQRRPGPMGRSLGKTTGWVHRAHLKRQGVRQLSGVRYRKIDDAGLHIERDGAPELVAADSIVICAGQEANDSLRRELAALGLEVHAIGGAREAGELDAERAIREGVELAARL